MGRTNFTLCANEFIGNNSKYTNFIYKGTLPSPGLISRNYTSQITYEGCLKLCGSGVQYYSWDQISNTILTWTLPVLGITLLAPFESNAFWETVFTLSRWIGNPIASIASTLWNIKITGKCAMLVDLAVPYKEPRGELHYATNRFAQMRDSLYILVCMNQYTIHPEITTDEAKQAAETLVRVAVFGRLLHKKGTASPFLILSRKHVAQRLRNIRKRGVVPVLISVFWFLFSLVLCIQSALLDIGINVTAHDLALGLLLGWFPILFMSFIIDRNPTNSEDVRGILNTLISEVRDGFDDAGPRNAYIHNQELPGEGLKAEKIERMRGLPKHVATEFFVSFAGQGRSRWHYGVAHPILADMEQNFINEIGRDWLRDDLLVLKQLILGDTDKRGLIWLDRRQLWQVANATFIVLGTITGAFVLSYFEPTVGLGCRSGGYMIFAIVAVALVLMEFISWGLIAKFDRLPVRYVEILKGALLRFTTVLDVLDEQLTRIRLGMPALYRRIIDEDDYITSQLERRKLKRSKWRMRDWANHFIFRPLESANLGWLSYICMAQTLGSYRTCGCQSSEWGKGGGYIDLNQYFYSNSRYLKDSWKGTTALALTIMGINFIYISVEWCLQSHLSTANYQQAVQGLRWTRRFRRLTFPYRVLYDAVIRVFLKERRSVFWTYKTYHHPQDSSNPSRSSTSNLPRSPSDPGQTTRGQSYGMTATGAQPTSTAHPAIRTSSEPNRSADVTVMAAYGEQALQNSNNTQSDGLLQVPQASLASDSEQESVHSSQGSEVPLVSHTPER